MSKTIALFGASGMVGSRIAQEAVGRGHTVIAYTRSGAQIEGATSRQGDLGSAADVAQAAADADVIISATGPSRTGEDHAIWLTAVDNLLANAGQTPIVFTGGAGSLIVGGQQLVQSPEFPEAYKAEALTAGKALDKFRASQGVTWTFVSPSPAIAPGERHATYITGDDSPAGDFVSAEDFAQALVDEAETGAHQGARFTVASPQ